MAKLHWQKYRHRIAAVRSNSLKLSRLSPTRLLVFSSEITKEWVLGSRDFEISGMGKIVFPWKYCAYLPIWSFSYSSGSLGFSLQMLARVGFDSRT